MIRREFLGACAAGASLAQTGKRPPNFIYIHSHDSGRYLQPYGHNVPAPALQKLAEGGVLFRRAFNAAPTCSPSRAALLTGQSAHSSGMLGLAHRGFSLNDPRQHIVNTLRQAGYYSALYGVQHVARNAADLGYDRVEQFKGGARAPVVGPAAAQFLKAAPKQPFFLDVGFFETHREYPQPGPAEDPRYCLPPASVPDTPETRRDIAGFKASARLMDAAVGQVLEALESAGLADNTVVISTTDHGIAFPAMKCNLSDHGMGVSLIMRGPGGFSGGKVCDALISQVDLFPTVCDLAGAAYPAWLQGRSILPVVRGEKAEVRDELFGEVTYHASYEPQRAVRTHRWNYVRRFGGRTRPVLPNCDDGLSKDVWLKHGWKERTVDQEALYDLMFDPNETRNVAAAAGNREVLADMRARLDRWMRETADPLLKGPVRLPAGAVANDVDGVSPKDRPRP